MNHPPQFNVDLIGSFTRLPNMFISFYADAPTTSTARTDGENDCIIIQTFVLNQKIATLKEERDPLDRKIKEKEGNIRDMYNELLEEFTKKNSLKEKTGKLKDKNKAVEELNNSLRNQIFQNKRKMTLFQSELAQMMKTTEKNYLVKALKELYDKQYKQYQKEKTQAIFKKQHENAFLIATCNELRNEKQKLLKIISKLKDEVKDLSTLMPGSSNPAGFHKIIHSVSVPAFSELPYIGSLHNTLTPIEKKNTTDKLQNIVTQLDKNRDKLAQQTMEFKKLEEKMNFLIKDND